MDVPRSLSHANHHRSAANLPAHQLRRILREQSDGARHDRGERRSHHAGRSPQQAGAHLLRLQGLWLEPHQPNAPRSRGRSRHSSTTTESPRSAATLAARAGPTITTPMRPISSSPPAPTSSSTAPSPTPGPPTPRTTITTCSGARAMARDRSSSGASGEDSEGDTIHFAPNYKDELQTLSKRSRAARRSASWPAWAIIPRERR